MVVTNLRLKENIDNYNYTSFLSNQISAVVRLHILESFIFLYAVWDEDEDEGEAFDFDDSGDDILEVDRPPPKTSNKDQSCSDLVCHPAEGDSPSLAPHIHSTLPDTPPSAESSECRFLTSVEAAADVSSAPEGTEENQLDLPLPPPPEDVLETDAKRTGLCHTHCCVNNTVLSWICVFFRYKSLSYECFVNWSLLFTFSCFDYVIWLILKWGGVFLSCWTGSGFCH